MRVFGFKKNAFLRFISLVRLSANVVGCIGHNMRIETTPTRRSETKMKQNEQRKEEKKENCVSALYPISVEKPMQIFFPLY